MELSNIVPLFFVHLSFIKLNSIMAGHIKLDRKIINWEWYCDVNVSHLFIYLILKANFKEGKWRGILVKRGQLITGRLKVSKDTGLSEMQIRTCLNKLKLTKEIITEVTNRFTIITICKYDVYQSLNNEDNQQNNQQITNESSNKYPTDNQQITTIEEELRRKKKKEEDKKNEENFVFWENEKKSFLNSGDWIFKFCRDKDLKLEKFDEAAKEFLDNIELKEDYKDTKELKRHFTNWYDKNKKNGTKISNGIAHGSKSAGAYAFVEKLKNELRTN